jgi:hypothetical protein
MMMMMMTIQQQLLHCTVALHNPSRRRVPHCRNGCRSAAAVAASAEVAEAADEEQRM